VSRAEVVRLLWVQRCVNSSERHVRAAAARDLSDLVASQRILGVDTDTDDISLLDAAGIQGSESLID
jgi:hypothetical protein